jgi:hypothetical protein
MKFLVTRWRSASPYLQFNALTCSGESIIATLAKPSQTAFSHNSVSLKGWDRELSE